MGMRRIGVLLAAAALAVLLASGVYLLGAEDAHATSPLTDKIVFVRDQSTGPGTEIYVMNADGSHQTNLTNTAALESTPAISPDGTKIAYSRTDPSDINDEIYVMNADGSHQTRLTFRPGNDQAPDWSPDGKKIVFHNCRADAPCDIYVMDADGSNQTRLTDWAANPPAGGRPELGGFQQPTFSPEGNKIAFGGGPLGAAIDSNEWAIYLMNADGSDLITLIRSSGYGFADPAFSPDGNSIAAIRWVASPGVIPQEDIILAAVDGSDQRNLTNNGSNGEPTSSNVEPTFSPDGTKIAFHSNRDGNFQIYKMNIDGSAQTNLTNRVEGNDFSPDWGQFAELGPTSRAACKKGGYKELGFKNQGQCIKAVKKAR
jgi:Tol biopolymer transport system component